MACHDILPAQPLTTRRGIESTAGDLVIESSTEVLLQDQIPVDSIQRCNHAAAQDDVAGTVIDLRVVDALLVVQDSQALVAV